MSDMIQHLPAIALRGTTILPDMIVHFDVSREKSIKAIEKAMVQDQRVFLIITKRPTDGRTFTGGFVYSRYNRGNQAVSEKQKKYGSSAGRRKAKSRACAF